MIIKKIFLFLIIIELFFAFFLTFTLPEVYLYSK